MAKKHLVAIATQGNGEIGATFSDPDGSNLGTFEFEGELLGQVDERISGSGDFTRARLYRIQSPGAHNGDYVIWLATIAPALGRIPNSETVRKPTAQKWVHRAKGGELRPVTLQYRLRTRLRFEEQPPMPVSRTSSMAPGWRVG